MVSPSIQTQFLSPQSPVLPQAVDYLLTRWPSGDLSQVIVVLPGSLAGRRLLELLLAETTRRDLPLRPPTMTTAGGFPEMLYPAKRPLADDLVQQFVWAQTLREGDREALRGVNPRLPESEDMSRWLEFGNLLKAQHRELAADGHDFAKVAASLANSGQQEEANRWRVLAVVQQAYLQKLDALDLWDVQTARLFAIEYEECETECDIVLLGTVDLNHTQRAMLDQVGDKVTALVHAPEQWRDRFDEHGCLRPQAWSDVVIDVPFDIVDIVDSPADQSAQVVAAIASFEGAYRGDQITIGVPDESLVPHLQRQLDQCQLVARWGPGHSIAMEPPVRLLLVVASYLETKSYEDFAALVRHPDVYSWLLWKEVDPNYLSSLDRFRNTHLPATVDGEFEGDSSSAKVLKVVGEVLRELLGELLGEGGADASGQDSSRRDSGRRGACTTSTAMLPLGAWSEHLRALMGEVYGARKLNLDVAEQRRVFQVCRHICKGLDQIEGVPATVAPEVSASQAIRHCLDAVGGQAVPPPPDSSAIEMLGWLELALDDAPALVVTSVNEGVIPQSLNSDLFLPNSLRVRLGLLDNERRYARDAYTMSLLRMSRKELRLIVGRRDGEKNPLAPSRLLLATEDSQLAERVEKLFESPDNDHPKFLLPGNLVAGKGDASFVVPRPVALSKPIDSLSVTRFREYIACPYRFYLRSVRKLRALDDSVGELDGGMFGTLMHDVLAEFGASSDKDSRDGEQVYDVLSGLLNFHAKEWFGSDPLSPVKLQIEQCRHRLKIFSDKQAEWAAKGWSITHTEVSCTDENDPAVLMVDEHPFGIRGRIDRIDEHEVTGEHAIFDYKSSDAGDPPQKTHFKSRQWVDLQLPLYRHLARAMGIETSLKLGYITLPRASEKAGFQIAPWQDEQLLAADDVAFNVIRGLRREDFWPPADPPPSFSEDLSAICLDTVLASQTENEEGEE